MFSLTQIEDVHERLGRAKSLAAYLRALAELGVVRYESFVSDGHTEFFAADGASVVSPPHHEQLTVNDVSDRAAFTEHLRRHAESETSYVEMSRDLAASGVEKWTADTTALTMSYLACSGESLLVEHLAE